MAGPNDEYVFWLPATKERPIGVGIPRADTQSPLSEDLSRGSAPLGARDETDAFIEERTQQMGVEAMPDVIAADRENEAATEMALDEETDKQVTDSGLVNDGPDQAQYDYRGLVGQGGNLKAGADGQGVDLPNQHWKPNTYGIAGIDVATGDRVTNRWPDEDGFIQGGIDAIRASTSNTVKGPPVEDIEALSNIAYGIQQDGGTLEDYKGALGEYHNDENIQRAWNATMRVRKREVLEEFAYEHGEAASEAITEAPVPQLPEKIRYEELSTHPEWMEAAQILWDELEGDNPITQGTEGEYFAGPEERAPLPPEELSEWLASTMSAFNWNIPYMSYLALRTMEGDPAFAAAVYNAMTVYDNLEVTSGSTGRAFGWVMGDPTTYVSFGAGSLAARAASLPLKSMIARVALGGAAGGAVEGGAFMVIDDTMRQTVAIEAGAQEGRDIGQTAAAGAMGVAAGTVLGGPLAAAVSKPARQLYMRAGRRVAENARSVRHVAPGTPMAQTGAVGDLAAGRATKRAQAAREKIASGQRGKINDLDVIALMETSRDHTNSPVSFGEALDHTRKTLKRKAHGDWEPQWRGQRLCDDDGCVELGLPTMEHWVTRVEEMLSPEEIADAANWYSTIADAFQAEFGDEGAQVMIAWLMSNQNVDPAGALMNALRVREQVASGAKGKLGGLSDEMVRTLFSGKMPDKGMRLKLHDFIDSALGKDWRTVAGNVPELGAPAVIDVHSARDMGYIDPAYRNYLMARFGKEALEAIGIPTEWGGKLDFGKEYLDKKTGKPTASGGVTDTQYEHAANRMRALTEELNAAGTFGGNLTPMQVQAIGWTAQARRTGSEAFNAVQSIERNTRQLSYELSPGAASVFAARFGARFDALDYNEKARITRKVTDLALGVAVSIVRPHESVRFFGPGGWMDAPAMPSAHTKVVSSKEAAEDTADVMGYLLQQDAVMVSRPVPKKTGWKAGLDIIGDALSNPEKVTEFWKRLQEAAPELKELGFMPVREAGGEGIRIVFTKGGDKYAAKLEADLAEKIEQIAADMDIDVSPAITKIEATFHGNDWNTSKKGEEYLARLKKRYGSRVPRTLEREHQRNIARVFDEELTKAEERTAGKAGDGGGGAGASRIEQIKSRFKDEIVLRPKGMEGEPQAGMAENGMAAMWTEDGLFVGHASLPESMQRQGLGAEMLKEFKRIADEAGEPLLLDPIASAKMRGSWKKAFGRLPTEKDFGLVGAKSGPPLTKLTKGERQLFEEIMANPADRKELLEAVPGIQLTEDGELSIPTAHVKAFGEYLDGLARLHEGPTKLPPGVSTGKLVDKVLKSGEG